MYTIKYIHLNEGIDIDYDTRTVSFNLAHENNVDTSIEHNPYIDNSIIPNVEVYSIFTRKRSRKGDGNPLIYAFKKEDGWKFSSNNDRKYLEWRIQEIVTKFLSYHHTDIVIIIPSTNTLNSYIANVIKMNLNPQDNVTFIGDALTKLTTEEVYHIAVDTKDSIFREAFKGHMNDAVITLKRYLDEMDEHKDGYFVRHYVRNSKMRKILDQTFKLSTSRYAEYANLINDKNVLLLDDTISRGQSIQEACKIIESSYNPKSVSVLTLMSKLK